MPTPEELEVADLLLRKAASDLSAARALAGDPNQSDDVVGFHSQQAVEKALKSVLAIQSLEIPRTHDLLVLLRLLSGAESHLPEEVTQAPTLSPWAVATRYDELEATLDREAALRIAEAALSWAQSVVDAARTEALPDEAGKPPTGT